MNNVTFDSTSFSKELGIYDFFNVLLSGSVFVCGLSIISLDIKNYLWDNLSIVKGLGLVLLIYIVGMIMQEIGSALDKYVFNIYRGMQRKVLKGKVDKEYEIETKHNIVKNPMLLTRYRNTTYELLKEFNNDDTNDKEKMFESEITNNYVFSVCHYYVSAHGKDKKVEKMRALFAMSKTLMACFFILSLCALFSVFFNTTASVDIITLLGCPFVECTKCATKVLFSIIFAVLGVCFVFRSKRTMKNFLLILFGTYDAIMRSSDKDEVSSVSE